MQRVRGPRAGRLIGSSTRPRGHIDGSVGSADGACPARRDRISAGTLTHSNRFIFGPVRTVSVVCSAPANAWCDRRTVGPSPWRFCRIDGAGRWRGGGVAVGVFGLRERPMRTRDDRRLVTLLGSIGASEGGVAVGVFGPRAGTDNVAIWSRLRDRSDRPWRADGA